VPSKVLIANRGEISIRIARTLRELEIPVVAVFTEADRGSLHLRHADEAVALGDDPRAYLDVQRIIDAARRSGADAIHPGYGFLSENPELSEACQHARLTFIGPSASAIRAMGNKPRARALLSAAGVPVVPGGPAGTSAEATETARRLGYPIMVKATDGGGGKGMRRVESEADLPAALERTASEAEAAFGSRSLYLEKAIDRPRHVEIQLLGDRDGRLITLFERDCSIQRRHQKIVEETPCPALPAALLEQMSAVALRAAESIAYYSAGTIEFLLSPNGEFYFLEMNTRLQVEHPITELLTGVDLVKEMIRVAAGEALGPEPVVRRGAAIEVRINAEDPRHGFLPSPGRIERWAMPAGPFVRVDSGVTAGSEVTPFYDPLLAKLSVWAEDRPSAVRRLRRALRECTVIGIQTNLGFLMDLADTPNFERGEYDTDFVAQNPELGRGELPPEAQADIAAALSALAAGDQRAKSQRPAAAGNALSPWVMVERARLR
jgi:acetyl-CoA carboxylase biotin carboxylase subunit